VLGIKVKVFKLNPLSLLLFLSCTAPSHPLGLIFCQPLLISVCVCVNLCFWKSIGVMSLGGNQKKQSYVQFLSQLAWRAATRHGEFSRLLLLLVLFHLCSVFPSLGEEP
jgi:hypothetical protein